MAFIHYLIFLSLSPLSHTSWIVFSFLHQTNVHSKICYFLVELWFNGIGVRIQAVNKLKKQNASSRRDFLLPDVPTVFFVKSSFEDTRGVINKSNRKDKLLTIIVDSSMDVN